MKPGGMKQSRIWLHRAKWAIAALLPLSLLLLLVTLSGCLTSYAAGPILPTERLAQETNNTSQVTSPTATSPAAVTLVPHIAVRSFQTTTPTATTTVTPTAAPPTDTPTATVSPTDTPEPTDTPQPTNTSAPSPTPRPTTVPATPAPFQAFAWVDNYYPAPGSVVTVHGRLFKEGRPVNGAHMGATWSYTHRDDYCNAYTGIDGRATCALNIGYPLQNYWVYIDVVFLYENERYYARTAFLTDP